MNISNIILALQEKLKTVTTTLELATLSKVIGKLKVNSVTVVDRLSDLPSVVEDGTIFLVRLEKDMYFSSANRYYSLGNIVNSTLYSWGSNDKGKLGDGTIISRSSPVTVVGGIINWSQVSAGKSHNLGIADGIAYSWGFNNNYELGDGTNLERSSPVTVIGGITGWSSVSAGGYHSLGIANGIAYAWGDENNGALGNNAQSVDKSSPVTVVGGITSWNLVSAGLTHSLGIASGRAFAWGLGTSGKLGDGTAIARSSPVTVVGGITNWSSVSAGSEHSLGIANGIAYAWGNNLNGRLGDGTSAPKSSPVIVIGGITNWNSVSAGGRHSLGIANGIAYAWGDNVGSGQLGDGTAIPKTSPVTVVGGITNWSTVSAGATHSLGIANGIAYAWGAASNGILGNNTSNPARSSPVTVVGGITNWSQVSAGGDDASNSQSLAISAITSFTP